MILNIVRYHLTNRIAGQSPSNVKCYSGAQQWSSVVDNWLLHHRLKWLTRSLLDSGNENCSTLTKQNRCRQKCAQQTYQNAILIAFHLIVPWHRRYDWAYLRTAIWAGFHTLGIGDDRERIIGIHLVEKLFQMKVMHKHKHTWCAYAQTNKYSFIHLLSLRTSIWGCFALIQSNLYTFKYVVCRIKTKQIISWNSHHT